jgi:hypothetical protein
MGFPRFMAWFAGIRDSEMARLRSERRTADENTAKAIFIKNEQENSNERLLAIITRRDEELDTLRESSQQQQLRIDALEGQNKIQEDEIKSLVKWLDREFAMKEKHLAMHERARYLAMNSLQPPEPDEYDDQLS